MVEANLAGRPTASSTEPISFIRKNWVSYVIVLLVWIGVFAIRLGGPPDLLDQDQQRPAAYVLDAVRNGNWICQRDLSGDISSKPPLYTWFAAGLTALSGRISLFTLYLPGALATLGSAWLLLAFGRRYLDAGAALFGALALLLTPAGFKQVALARTDALFAFTVTAGALFAFRAWQLGRGWTWFWLMGAAATLTKGPLGPILAAGGLLAAWWERKSSDRVALKGSHLAGIGLFLLITAGWFLLAYREFGQALIDKMIGKELVGHAMQSGKGSVPGSGFYKPALYYLGRAAPWSLFGCYGLWRLWKYPANRSSQRSFERFLFCWFMAGLVIFSLAPHQRGDLLWPILPAGALLAGRELTRLSAPWPAPRRLAVATVTVMVALGGFSLFYFGVHSRKPVVRQTIAVKQLARSIEQAGGREFPLSHVDSPVALQVYLNTLYPPVSAARAAELLRGPEAAYLALKDTSALEMQRRPDDPQMYVLFPPVEPMTNRPAIICANRAQVNPTEPTVFCFGPLLIRMSGARLARASENDFWFQPIKADGRVVLTNESSASRRVHVRVGSKSASAVGRTLAAGEAWEIEVGTWR